MSFQENLFTTEVGDLRPLTTTLGARRIPAERMHLQLKQIKDRAKSLEQKYLEEKMHHDRIRKNVEDINHVSALKRMQFLKAYANKKAKFHTRQLLQTHKQERQRFERKSVELVKRRKLEQQLQQILLQNETEDRIYQMQKSNNHNKEILKKELLLANQRQRSYQRHEEVKKANNELLVRKRNLQTAITVRSKRNYFAKLNQEFSLIQNYENILNQVERLANQGDFQGQSKLENQTMCQTIERGQTVFLTSKNTVQ